MQIKAKSFYLWFFILTPMLTLISCSDESKIKDVALKSAQERFENKLKTEADKVISGKTNLKSNYIHSVLEKTDFEVDSVRVNSASAQANVQIETVPSSVRQPLLEIIAKLDDNKESSFNTSDALSLVYEKMQISTDKRSKESLRINLHKKSDWLADPEK